MVEWAELSATLPDLTSMRGVKIFYKVASPTTTASPSDANNNNASNSMSGSNINRDTSPMSQLSSLNRAIPIPRCLYQWWSVVGCARMMKPLGVVAWKCKKLRIGWWIESDGKVQLLLRDHEHGHVGEVGNGKERLTSAPITKVRWEVRRLKTSCRVRLLIT